MAKLLVNIKLNKRSAIPRALPDVNNIVGTVPKGHVFFGTEVTGSNLPAAPLNKWFRDTEGFYYWGGAVSVLDLPPVELPRPAEGLSLEQIKFATGASALNAEKFMPYIIDTCKKFEISTPVRQLCFLAQLGHESMGLFYTEELASGKAYENRKDLGNTQPGDGVRFKGRGLIQITGRANYSVLAKALEIDLINSPGLLGAKNINSCNPDQLKNAALSAGWFWNSKKLNALADNINLNAPVDDKNNLQNFKGITKKINGGYNGLDDRLKRYKAGVNFFS